MSDSISRRSILNAAAAIAATTTAALPVLAAGSLEPDAELLRLGAVFDELHRQYWDARTRWAPHDDFVEEEFAKLNDGQPHTEAEYKAVWRRADEEVPIAAPRPTDISDAMDDPQRQIMALQPKTLAGLIVKAKVAQFGCEHMYEGNFDDRDWDHKTATQLIDAVLAMAEGNANATS